jgi:hypothetical protein
VPLAEVGDRAKVGHVAGHDHHEAARRHEDQGECLQAADATDAGEDKLHGNKPGDEKPKWVSDKHKRLAKLREAKAEAEARLPPAAGHRSTSACRSASRCFMRP